MKLHGDEILDPLVTADECTIHLFDRDTLRIETEDQDIFLAVEEVETAVEQADHVSYSTLTDLDRRIITRIWFMKNGRYAALEKQLRKDAHSGDYFQTLRAIRTEEDGDLLPQDILNRLDEITERCIRRLEEHLEHTGWPSNFDTE